MAGSFASTDSSQTLSATANAGADCAYPSHSAALLTTLTKAPHKFLKPPGRELQDAALALAKRYLDPLIVRTGRSGGMGIDMVYVEGFDYQQVWEQVRGVVVDLEEVKEAKRDLGVKMVGFVGKGEEGEEDSSDEEEDSGGSGGSDEEEDMVGESEGEGGVEDMGMDVDEDQRNGVDIDEEAEPGPEEAFELADKDEEEEIGSGEEVEEEIEEEEQEFVEDKFGLNDGFFSIDNFNRQTELLELEDEHGALPDDSDDEDEIDLHADPAEWEDKDEEDDENDEDDAALMKSLAKMTNGKSSKAGGTKSKRKGKAKATESDDEEDDNMHDDFNGVDSDGDIDMDGPSNLIAGNANGIMYKDFFAPPARKNSKRPNNYIPKHKQSWRVAAEKEDRTYEQVEADMNCVRRDIFDEEDAESGDDADVDKSDPLSRRSTHQKRQAALSEEIRQLEAAAVAKRGWLLSGEASARSRPQNSLLEEDLDFERVGKPVPVITAEVTESLEDLIKRRIIASEFDEVLRRRPDAPSSEFRRGRVDIDDSKPQQSLSALYEAEHAAATQPGVVAAKDAKLAKEHAEIEKMWGEVSRKLDALSSWHYTPKPAAASITVVSDAPALAMEDAQPTTTIEAAETSRLAPQEIYQPGKDKAVVPLGGSGGREIVTKGGAPVSTREMTTEEKKRRRRREKVKIRKRNAEKGVGVHGEVKEGSKKDVVDTLKRGGVRFIGKDGGNRDVDGNVVKDGENDGGKGHNANFIKL